MLRYFGYYFILAAVERIRIIRYSYVAGIVPLRARRYFARFKEGVLLRTALAVRYFGAVCAIGKIVVGYDHIAVFRALRARSYAFEHYIVVAVFCGGAFARLHIVKPVIAVSEVQIIAVRKCRFYKHVAAVCIAYLSAEAVRYACKLAVCIFEREHGVLIIVYFGYKAVLVAVYGYVVAVCVRFEYEVAVFVESAYCAVFALYVVYGRLTIQQFELLLFVEVV